MQRNQNLYLGKCNNLEVLINKIAPKIRGFFVFSYLLSKNLTNMFDKYIGMNYIRYIETTNNKGNDMKLLEYQTTIKRPIEILKIIIKELKKMNFKNGRREAEKNSLIKECNHNITLLLSPNEPISKSNFSSKSERNYYWELNNYLENHYNQIRSDIVEIVTDVSKLEEYYSKKN